MNILHVVHGYYPALGGSERLIQRISENLVSQYDDHVQVFTANGYNNEAFTNPAKSVLPPGNSDLNDVHIRRFAVFNRLGKPLYHLQRAAYHLSLPGNQYLRTLYNGPILPGLQKAIETSSVDVVAAAAFPLLHMFTTLRACKRSGKPLVFIGALHPLNEWGYQRPMIYKAIHQVDAYIALSRYERDYLIEQWQVPSQKIWVIGGGVEMEPFLNANPADIRTQYQIGNDPLVAFIGQQGENKGVDTLLTAMKEVWQQLPEAWLLIAGAQTHFSTQLHKWAGQALPTTMQERLIFIDNFAESEKAKLFAACDVFAYPSRYESFGIAFIEAWSAGKPVVGCRVGAVPSVVDDERDGLLVPVDDAKSLAGALLRLLKSPHLRARLGQAGQEKVAQHYTWSVVTERWRAVYDWVLNNAT